MFVILTACAGSLGNGRYVDRQLDFETLSTRLPTDLRNTIGPTDRLVKVCEKSCPISGKAYMFKEELSLGGVLRGRICFVEQRDFDNPGIEDLINEDCYEFRGLVKPEAYRRTAPGYAHGR